MKGKTTRELAAMESTLNKKNTYMHLFKNGDKAKRETIAEKTGRNIIFVYDQVIEDEDKYGYDPKSKRDSHFKQRNMPVPHKEYGNVMTTS